VGIVGNAHAARFGDSLKARGDIDPIAENIVFIEDDVADVNADAKIDPEFRRHINILSSHLSLDFHPATRCIDGTGELNQHAIACGLDDAAAMGGNPGIDNRFPKRL
jgi:hypothetical protein